MTKRLAIVSKSTVPLPLDYAPLLAVIKARMQADAVQTLGRDLRQTTLAKGKPGVSRHLDVAAPGTELSGVGAGGEAKLGGLVIGRKAGFCLGVHPRAVSNRIPEIATK